MIDFDQLSEHEIEERLEYAQRNVTNTKAFSAYLSDAPRLAAVLIPLLRTPIEGTSIPTWHVLLTKRSPTLAEHSGQVAFPGGQSDPVDATPEETALREAHEEIGLNPRDIRILGKLDSLVTITNYQITPVIGVIRWPATLQLSGDEVERVFTVPLKWLSEPENHEIRYRTLPPPISTFYGTESHPVIYFRKYQDDVLWGASADIMMRFLKIIQK